MDPSCDTSNVCVNYDKETLEQTAFCFGDTFYSDYYGEALAITINNETTLNGTFKANIFIEDDAQDVSIVYV